MVFMVWPSIMNIKHVKFFFARCRLWHNLSCMKSVSVNSFRSPIGKKVEPQKFAAMQSHFVNNTNLSSVNNLNFLSNEQNKKRIFTYTTIFMIPGLPFRHEL